MMSASASRASPSSTTSRSHCGGVARSPSSSASQNERSATLCTSLHAGNSLAFSIQMTSRHSRAHPLRSCSLYMCRLRTASMLSTCGLHASVLQACMHACMHTRAHALTRCSCYMCCLRMISMLSSAGCMDGRQFVEVHWLHA